MSKENLTQQILIAMLLGGVVGGILNFWVEITAIQWLINNVFHVIGQIFIRLLSMLVVPLVFVSLVCGVAALGDTGKLGRLGGKALLFYLTTTAIAISLALAIATVVAPGQGYHPDTQLTYSANTSPSIAQTIIELVPNNPIQAMAQGQMLPLIIFALLFGIALLMAKDLGERVAKAFNDLNEINLQIVVIVMKFAPLGVFCLISKTFAIEGFGAIQPLLDYFLVVIVTLLIHAFIVYPLLIKGLSGLAMGVFLKKMYRVQIFAFSTASSNATIPVNIANAEKRLGVNNSVAAFTIPLGATINMDGTAIMQGVATMFIANAYGIDLTLGDYTAVILTATLASVGTAGVPGVGLIMLAMVLKQVGLPVEGIALIMGIDRLLDMLRTAVNVTGDAVATVILAKSEDALDQQIYLANNDVNRSTP